MRAPFTESRAGAAQAQSSASLDDAAVTLHVFATFEPGGAQLRTRDLIAAHAVPGPSIIVTLDGGATDPHLLVPLRDGQWTALPKAGSVRTVRGLMRVLRRVRPRLVLTYDWGAIDAVVANRWSLRAPLVHHEDGVGADEAHGEKRRRRFARRAILRWADGVVVPSEGRQTVAERDWRVPSRRLQRISNGVDAERFGPGREPGLRRAWGVPSAAPVIGALGRLARVKRLDRVIDALGRLDPGLGAHLVVAGTGPEQDALRRRAARLGVEARVRWLGHVPHPERVLPEFDVFVSSSESEQQPRALLEAMACARPVVASRVGDAGLVVPPAQSEFVLDLEGSEAGSTLAQALERLLRNPDQRRELGRRNRERVIADFGFGTMQRAFEQVYAKAMGAAQR